MSGSITFTVTVHAGPYVTESDLCRLTPGVCAELDNAVQEIARHVYPELTFEPVNLP
jgi:hypothetical protein